MRAWTTPLWLGGLLCLIVGITAPANVLNRYPILALFVERSGALFPAVQGFQQTSVVPQVAALVTAIACWVAPLQFFMGVWSGSRKTIPQARLAVLLKWSWFARLALLAGMPIAIVAAYLGLYLTSEDPSFCEGCANSSRVGLVLFVGLLPPVLALVSHAYVAVARHTAVILSASRPLK